VTSVLITRILKPQDEQLIQLVSKEYQLEGISFVSFEAIPFDEIPEADWLFFYSKRGVQYFFKQPNDNEFLKKTKIAVMGKGTASELSKIAMPVDFIGEGQPQEVAAAFLQIAKGQSILFIRALHSNNSVRKLLENESNCNDLIVYKNTIQPHKLEKAYDVIIFTSPLNVEGFFSLNQLEKHTKVISIGPSTTQKLIELNVDGIIESPNPEMERLIHLLFS